MTPDTLTPDTTPAGYPDGRALKNALLAQSACNPLPLLAAVETWCREARAAGTFDPGARAPLHVRLLVGQLSYLLGCGLGPTHDDLMEAHNLVHGPAQGEAV